MTSAYYELFCPRCENELQIGVSDQANSVCFGGVITRDRYQVAPKANGSTKLLDVLCRNCGAEIQIPAPTEQKDGFKAGLLDKSEGGALTIKHLGGGTPGIINFSMLYPNPPQTDNQGNIALPVGGTIRVFRAIVGDIFVFRQIDPPIKLINESQTGYFRVALKLHNEPAFSRHANIWGKAVVAQHPHMQNSVVYEIAHPQDRIHLTYHTFSKYLLDSGTLSTDEVVTMPLEKQFEKLLEVLKDEKP